MPQAGDSAGGAAVETFHRQEECGLRTEQRWKSSLGGPLELGLSKLSHVGLGWFSYAHLRLSRASRRGEGRALGRGVLVVEGDLEGAESCRLCADCFWHS